MVQIALRGKNVEITPGLRDHVEKRLRRFARYFEDGQEVQVVLRVEKSRHIVEVTVPLDGAVLRGEEETDDMYASVDRVVDKLERQVDRYRARWLGRRGRQGGKGNARLAATVSGEDEPRVVKTKRFAMKPMTVDEALLQMNLVGHDFYVFVNAETEQVNVIYRRKDGNYGLIEPGL